jgi:site-specific DNA recombinase
MKAGLYSRVSQDKQRENYSIPTQLEAMREYCTRNKWEVVKEYIEDESGAKLNRPALDQVREDAAQGLFDVLVCHDVDRFGRNLGHQILLEEELAKHGVQVRFVLGDYKDNPEGRLTKHIKGVIAEYEREKILERTFRGRLGRAKSGQITPGRHSPYGYTYKNEGRRGWLEVVPEEAEVVREIYRLYTEDRLSAYEIAQRLTARHIPTAGDRPHLKGQLVKRRTSYGDWSPSSVSAILRNETYTGTWHDNKRKRGKAFNPKDDWVPVHVPPIVARETWEQAEERRAINRERLRRRPKHPYLLSGMLRCGSCRRAFIGGTSVAMNRSQPKAYHYYRCSDSSRGWVREPCHEPKVNAESADELVWAKVSEALRNPQLLIPEYARQMEEGTEAKAEERLNQVAAELERIKREQNRNLELYVAGEVDMPWLREHQDKLRARRSSLEREREALQRLSSRGKDSNSDTASFTGFCHSISERLDNLTLEEKRKVLHLLNIEGRVKGRAIMLTGCTPEAKAVPSPDEAFCGYQPTHQGEHRGAD